MSVLVFAMILAASGWSRAEVNWSQVAEKIQNADDYRVECRYRGPQGSYHLDYTVVRPGTIRAVFLPGSKKNVGAVSIYDPDRSADKVMMKFPGGGVVARRISHREIEGSPLHVSILDRLITRTSECGPPAVETGQKGTIKFRFACPDDSTLQVWVDPEGDVVRTETTRKQTLLEEVTLSGHEWNVGPDITF